MTLSYELHGSSYRSAIALPGYQPTDLPAERCIELGDVAGERRAAKVGGRLWSASDDEAFIDVPGVAAYRVHRGGITVQARGSIERVGALLRGTPLAASLMLGGATVLRGAAVLADPGVIVLAGAPGVGTSSLAGALIGTGAAPWSDRFVAIETRRGPLAARGPDGIELWHDMAAALGHDPAAASDVAPGIPKVVVGRTPCGESASPGPASAAVAAVFVVQRSIAAAFAVERLGALAATMELLSCHYHGPMAATLCADHLGAAARLAQQVPVFRVSSLWAASSRQHAIETLMEHVGSVRTAGAA